MPAPKMQIPINCYLPRLTMKPSLFLLSIVFFFAGCTASRQYFTDEKVIGPYTPAVKVGNLVYVSGQIALKPGTTELAGDDIEVQVRQVMENIKAVLARADATMNDVVQCTVYLKSMNDFAKMNPIYGSYFVAGRSPTRTTVEVSNLPRNAKVEITAVAYK
jgi:2-iminobutanoate/2-iminopropanoate deaminase